jgi:anti-anti-sigma regulatory factor
VIFVVREILAMMNNILFESPSDTVRIARFLRPDVRDALYDNEAIADTSLYKELKAGALDRIAGGETLILNFGLIDWFPTSFYRVLIQALQDVRAKGARITLCCLTDNLKEEFELMGGRKLFDVHSTEARAVAACQRKK